MQRSFAEIAFCLDIPSGLNVLQRHLVVIELPLGKDFKGRDGACALTKPSVHAMQIFI